MRMSEEEGLLTVPMPTRILVPTDFSEYSDRALRQAFDVAKQYNASVYILRIIHERMTDLIDDYGLSYPSYINDMETEMIKGAVMGLEKEIDQFPQRREVEVFTDVLIGNPSEAILEEEMKKGIDLVVIASLGRTGTAKYLMGSVVRNVLRGSK